MHAILQGLLKKRGIDGADQLSTEEKETFNAWDKTLSEGEMTVEKIQELCKQNIVQIETQFKDLDSSKEKLERLVLLHSVYSTIKDLIESPIQEREQLIRYLTDMA